jgi:2-methylcitrate dehydratase PrpD
LNETKTLVETYSKLQFDDIPTNVADHAKKCVLDGIGCTLVGSREAWSKVLLGSIKKIDRGRDATIIGDGKASCTNAALANGFMSHVLDFDDSYIESGSVHAEVVVVPAALAVAEKENASGKDLLTAVVAGYEVGCRILAAVNPSHARRGWHGTGTIGTFCAAAAAGRVLDLDSNQMLNALGIAGSQASGIQQVFGSMCKGFHAGKAAMNGVLAAILARDGFTSVPDFLDGKAGFARVYGDSWKPEEITRDLRQSYKILGNKFKIHASCGCTHAAFEAVLDIVRRESLKAEDVEEIRVALPRLSMQQVGEKNDPQNPIDAKFSVAFSVALAIVVGKADLGQFTQKRLEDPRIRGIMKKVRAYEDEEQERNFLMNRAFGARVEIKTTNGRSLVSTVDVPKGYSNKTPLSTEELEEKYRTHAKMALPTRKVEQTIQIIRGIEGLSSVKKLTRLLVRAS